MKTEPKKNSIHKVLERIYENSIILPSIQREFVWEKKQIIALFDSIMSGYPISTFLFWNIKEFDFSKNSYFYEFLKEVTFNFQGKPNEDTSSLIDSNILKNETIAVLDGQQRLTSLYIALRGRVKIKEKMKRKANSPPADLYLDLASGAEFFDNEEFIENEDDDEKKDAFSYTFDFQFFSTNPDRSKWFKVKEIFKLKESSSRETEIDNILKGIDSEIYENAKNNLNLLATRIFDEEIINILKLNQCELNEALEIFIRFNKGGKQLSKSDIVFSTIESKWPEAKDEVKQYLSSLNNGEKYKFSKDFIVRLALVLFGGSSDIQKTMINNGIVDQLKNDWNKIKKSINMTVEFLSKNLGITSDREISSYISIIPIVYSVFYNNCQIKNENDIKKYIYRSLILNIFSKRTSALLIELKNIIKNSNFLIYVDEIETKIVDFKITPDKIEQILDNEKSFTTCLTLFLMGNDNVFQNRDDAEYHQDHIHASAIFDNDNKKPHSISDAEWTRWGSMKNKLPNLHLLKGKPNQSKSKKELKDWLGTSGAPTEEEFKTVLYLPNELSIKLKDFEVFFNTRKDVLKNKLKKMLI